MNNIFKSTLVIAIIIASCQGGKESSSSSQRFSTKLDTSYKTNSTEIESITRTIYKNGSLTDDKMMTLNSKLGVENSLAFVFKDDNTISAVTFEDEKSLKKFIEDARTVLNNPDKDLNYTFGALNNGAIQKGTDKGTISLRVETIGLDKVTYNYINSAEIDSIESCYNRYKSEN